ncbi:MAG: adenylate kinase [Actinomycetales bacterium]|nr:adenylate kinase [Actinomycetales bacterium]
MRVLFMGPPGAGKGTQAALLAQRLGIVHISTGDIFRSNVSQGTPLGLRAKAFMDKGEYVPDDVTNDMVRDRLAQPDAEAGFILDGYPRTVAQVLELDGMLADSGEQLDAVIELTADTDELVTRLSKRAQEQGRTDDTPEVIRRRLEVYADSTAPLIALFAERGILTAVDGLGAIDDVTARLVTALAN